MSAWIVSKAHIDYMLTAVINKTGAEGFEFGKNGRYRLSPETATPIGQMLWKENHRSINYCYEHRHRTPSYIFEPYTGDLVDESDCVNNQVHCYNYQTCERPDYKSSAAYAFVQAMYQIFPDPPKLQISQWPWGIDG